MHIFEISFVFNLSLNLNENNDTINSVVKLNCSNLIFFLHSKEYFIQKSDCMSRNCANNNSGVVFFVIINMWLNMAGKHITS